MMQVCRSLITNACIWQYLTLVILLLEPVAAAKIELPRTHSNIAFRQFRSVEVLLERRVLWHRL